MSYSLIDRVIDNNNLFWEAVREYYLDDFLAGSYRSEKKRKIITRWIGRAGRKDVLIRQVDRKNRWDFISDFMLIAFYPDHFEVSVVDMEQTIEADVEIDSNHMALVTGTASIIRFLTAWLNKEIRLRKLWRRPWDHYWVARLFFL